MAKQTINIGAAPNDGTGTPLRTSFDYCNQNFTELYTATGPSGNNIVVPGSATITGDLTVDTNVLKVDTTLNRVGIGTASPATILDIQSAGGVFARIQNTTSTADAYLLVKNTTGEGFFGINALGPYIYTASALPIVFTTATSERYRIAGDGVATWSNVGGVAGTAMTLNSTGLGVGVTPAAGDGSGVFKAAGTGSFTASTRVGLDVRELVSGNSAGILLGAMTTENTGVIGARTGSGNIAFQTYNGSAWGERMRIDYLGNVGIGVTPSAWDTANYKALQVSRTAVASLSNIGIFAANWFADTGGDKYIANGTAARIDVNNSGQIQFKIAPNNTLGANQPITFTQAMTLDASGNLLVGTTSNAPAGTQSQFVNQWSGGAKWGSTFNQTVSSATSYTHIAFCTNGTVRGSIDANNTTITYGTVSDYRLKENVQPISNALTRIAALKPSTYKWKDSGTDGEGFIAHELAAVVPLAVIGQKDAVNEDGSIKAQQIDLSKVVPILVAAIKELTAEVNALKNA